MYTQEKLIAALRSKGKNLKACSVNGRGEICSYIHGKGRARNYVYYDYKIGAYIEENIARA